MANAAPTAPVVLIGPMGAGKSTVGKALAQHLGTAAVDSDDEFVTRHGQIPAFFADHGEEEFRRREAELIAELLDDATTGVVSLGGGAVLTESTRDLIAAQAFVVFLDIDTDSAMARLGRGENRPLLQGDPEGRWETIRAERLELYTEPAHLRLDVSDLSVADAVQEIAKHFQSHLQQRPPR